MPRFAGISAALGLAAATALVTMPGAQASPTSPGTGATITAYQDCPVGYFCAWADRGGWGAMARFQLGSDDLRDFNLNDKISSVWNRTGNTFCTWLNINRDGASWAVGNWRGDTVQYNREDNISSLWVGSC
ncbi:peptidase inhibitor family I36 protein [Streptomyces niveus]|uniref:peptidase inhibitor family I36 protein n=1 Tax=Streptomyces niveus TaxID=193462 RepID=UPI002E3061C4|nr:peptidase inhibitor family I36 protein [Streptomyces niveus]WTA60539.1 peptidase inhibitor family I36 protein [Streptomyces niveus]